MFSRRSQRHSRGRAAPSFLGATAQFITFPESFGAFTTDCIYQAATDAVAPNGSPFVYEVVLRATVANFVLNNEISRKGDPDSGWTMQCYTGNTLRFRHHDAALAPQQIGGLVPMSPMGQVIHAIGWFDGSINTARSFRQGVLVAETTITGARVADPASLLLIPGPGGNPEVEIAHIWASGNATVLGAFDTDAKVWARWVAVRDAMRAGLAPPDPASFDLHADASAAGVGTNPQNWVLTGATGGTIATFATAPPAERSRRVVSFASPTFPAPTMTAPIDEQAVTFGNNVTVSASFTRDTLVTKVDWYANGVIVATDSTTPYSATWTSPALGDYVVFARATYIDGSTQDSASVDVHVVSVSTPDVIFGADLLTWRRSEDATQSGGLLTGWPDKVGGGAITIVGAPTVNTADATLGNRQTVGFDGVAAALQQALDRPAPGTTPTTVVMVLKQKSWTSGECHWGPQNAIMACIQGGVSPQINLRNSTVGPSNGGFALNTWKQITALYNNSTTDYLAVGAASIVTGTNVGNVDPTGTWTWIARTLALFADDDLAEMMIVQRVFSGGDTASLKAYLDSIYIAGVTT